MAPSSRESRSGSSTRRAEPSRRGIVLPGGAITGAALVVAALSIPYLVFAPASTDLAAQTFRADLWDAHGWVLWNDAWYSGHLVPGYSLIYPPLGALFGPRLVGVLSALVAAVAFAAFVRGRKPGYAADVAALWFALGMGAMLYTGRITFMLGTAFAMLAMLALPRVPLAALLAALAALASPVAGLFTAIAGAALVLSGRVREGLWLGAAASVATLALVLVFPVGGFQPFAFSGVWWVVAACGLAILFIPSELRVLRIGIAIYAALLVVLFVVATPIGSNGPRLGALLMGPVAAFALLDRRPKLVAILALPLLWWQLNSPVQDLRHGVGDSSTEASFYEPLLAQLDDRTGGVPVRIEVPATRERWEAVHVAERYPIARGWMRQLETDDTDTFTDQNLTPENYQRWLVDHGASYVALPRATLDYLSAEEGWLLSYSDLPYLREVWSDDDWTLWEVRPDAGGFEPGAALAAGGARVTELGPDGFSVAVPGPGEYPLRMRWTSYFEVSSGVACVEDAGGESTRLVVPESAAGPQTVDVDVRLSLDGVVGNNRPCPG
jgi:hypothetical protein